MPTQGEAGRIDVHAHLLPGVDDGCQSVEESLACARALVEAGYTHAFCTPHIWPGFPNNTGPFIAARVPQLQVALQEADIPLNVLPGGEINIQAMWPMIGYVPPAEIPTFGLNGKYALVDFWADTIPEEFEAGVEYLWSLGLVVILAHPERIGAFQARPELAGEWVGRGLRLQGNLQCFADPPGSRARELAERYLQDGLYFLLGSDCHRLDSLPVRIEGLRLVTKLAGPEVVARLTMQNPRTLLASPEADREGQRPDPGRTSGRSV
jgi:protein-tyrosine phosphatase